MNRADHIFLNTASVDAGRPMVIRHLVNMAVGGVYSALLLQSYIVLSGAWGYLGFWYSDPGTLTTVISIIAAAMLTGSLPIGNWSVVGFTKWVLCITLFIPAIMIPPQQGILPTDQMVLLETLVFVSAAVMIFLLPNGRPLPPVNIEERVLLLGVSVLWLAAVVLILTVFQGSLNLVGLDQVYDQRSSASGLAGGIMGYVLGIFAGAVNPFLLIVGIKERRWVFVGMAVSGQVLVYATLAAKAVLGSTMLCVAVYFLFNRDRIGWLRVYSGILGLAIAGPFITRAQTFAGEDLWSTLSDLIYLRILTLPGVMTGVYADFFSKFPVTYLSHSLIGRPFTTYPYESLSIGQVIGYYVVPMAKGTVGNYNANFIAADGITGFGLFGIPFIMLFSMLVFWLMARLVGTGERALVCAILTPFIVSLADASIFTALLTSGGGLVMLLLYLRRSSRSHPAQVRARFEAGRVDAQPRR